MGGGHKILKTLLDVYLLPSNFATLIFYWKITATGTSTYDVCSDITFWRGVLYVYPRRGLATLLILVDGQCEGLMVG